MSRKRPDIKPDGHAPQGPDDHGNLSSRESASSVLRMGRFYLESDSYSDAMEYLLRAEADAVRSQLSDDEVASLYAGLARCSLGLGKHADARRHAERLANDSRRSSIPW